MNLSFKKKLCSQPGRSRGWGGQWRGGSGGRRAGGRRSVRPTCSAPGTPPPRRTPPGTRGTATAPSPSPPPPPAVAPVAPAARWTGSSRRRPAAPPPAPRPPAPSGSPWRRAHAHGGAARARTRDRELRGGSARSWRRCRAAEAERPRRAGCCCERGEIVHERRRVESELDQLESAAIDMIDWSSRVIPRLLIKRACSNPKWFPNRIIVVVHSVYIMCDSCSSCQYQANMLSTINFFLIILRRVYFTRSLRTNGYI